MRTAAASSPSWKPEAMRHLDLNDSLRRSGHFFEAEALEPGATTADLR